MMTTATNELQVSAIQVLNDAGHADARWWGPKDRPVSRIYFAEVKKPSRVYITFADPERLECPRLCVDLKDCGQKPSWYEGQRRSMAKKYLEGYARVLGLFEEGFEVQFRRVLETAILQEDFSIIDVGGKTF